GQAGQDSAVVTDPDDGSMLVPIATSPGPSGFGSQLCRMTPVPAIGRSVSAPDSPCLPSFTRPTRARPKSFDSGAQESDISFLSDTDGLMPELREVNTHGK